MRDFRVNRTQPALTWTVDFLSQKAFFSSLGGGCLVPPQSRMGEKRTGPQPCPSPPTPCSLTVTSAPALPFPSQDTPPPQRTPTHTARARCLRGGQVCSSAAETLGVLLQGPSLLPSQPAVFFSPQGEPFGTGVYFEVKERRQQWGSFPGAARESGMRQQRSRSRRNRKLSQSPLPPRATANQSTGR